jgi:Transposase
MTERSHDDEQAGRHHRWGDRGRHPPRHACCRCHRPGWWSARPAFGQRRCGRLPATDRLARAQMPGRRCWAVEGAGSYRAGLAAVLQANGERVVEVARPKRPPWRRGAKSDALDAVRAAREALACEHPLGPRRRGDREALPVLLATRHSACRAKVGAPNQLKALIVGAPEELRAELRGLATKRQIGRCASLRDSAGEVAGAPHDRSGAAHHRPPRPTAGRRGLPSCGPS